MCLIPCRRREKIKDITSDAVIYEGSGLPGEYVGFFFHCPANEDTYPSPKPSCLTDADVKGIYMRRIKDMLIT